MAVWPDGAGVEFQWTGSGTGSVVAGSALAHRRTPPGTNDGASGTYFIKHATLDEWESSTGTWDDATQTMTRGEDTIIGSNGAALVSFTASGLKIVSWVLGADLATASRDGLAAAAQITKLDALPLVAAGSTFDPAAIVLELAYLDYAQTGAIELAVSGTGYPGGASATVWITGNGANITVDGVTVFWADGETGAKTWTDKRPVAIWYHPAAGVAFAFVPGDAVAAAVWGAITGTLGDQADLQTALNAKAPTANPTFTGTVTIPDAALAIADTSGLQAALDAKLALAGGVMTGPLKTTPAAATLGSGAVTCNLALANDFAITINGSWNAATPLIGTNPPAAGVVQEITLVATLSGTQTIDLAGAPWTGGEPFLDLSAGAVIEVHAAWLGSTLVSFTAGNRS